MKIDLNADLGEAYGMWSMGNDAAMLDIVTSANIACGGHAGDGLTMIRSVRACRSKGVSLGAHPSFNDKQGFGRRRILGMSKDELCGMLLSQIGALAAIARAETTRLSHVKIHGALNNMASEDLTLAHDCINVCHAYDAALPVTVGAGTALETAAQAIGHPHLREIFADRNIRHDGTLVPRGNPNDMILDPLVAADRIVRCLEVGEIMSVCGTAVSVSADTVCVHGDTPGAVAFAATLRRQLEANGIQLESRTSMDLSRQQQN